MWTCELSPSLMKIWLRHRGVNEDSPIEESTDWLGILWWFMNEGKVDTRMVGYRIKTLFPDPKGTTGLVAVHLTPVMRVGDDWVPFATEPLSYENLNINFIQSQTAASMQALEFFCKAVVLVAAAVIQGLAAAPKKAAKSVLRKLLFKQIKKRFTLRARRKVFRALYSKIGRTVGKAGKDFCTTFVKELVKLNIEKKIRKATGDQKKKLVRDPFIRAMSAFVKGFVDGLFHISVRKEIATSPLLTKIHKEIATAVADRLFKGPTNVIVDTVSAAAEAAAADPNKKFSDLAAAELAKKPWDVLQKTLLDVIKYMAGKAS